MKYFLLSTLIIILLLFIWYNVPNGIGQITNNQNELLTNPTNSYILLYEGYNFKNLAYNFTPKNINYDTDDIGRGYIRQILKCDLKSLDINLSKTGKEFDKMRHVEIWAVDQKDNSTASSETGFYNSYLEPEIELRSNPARYHKLVTVLPGEHLRMSITEPVKKIFLIAIL